MIQREIITILLAFTISSAAYAQSGIAQAHQKTAVSYDARYDFVQSTISAKWTFRLDRYTGSVSQLVATSSGRYAWDAMFVKNIPKVSNPVKPRFILFMSGIASRHTYLLDSFTGKSWALTTTTDGKTKKTTNFWNPFVSLK